MIKNKIDKKVKIGLGMLAVGATIASVSSLVLINQDSQLYTQNVQTDTIATKSASSIKSISITKTRPAAIGDGYKEGSQIIFKLDVVMQDINMPVPDLTGIRWTCRDKNDNIIATSGAATFVIDFNSTYVDSTVSVEPSFSGVDASDPVLSNIAPVKLGQIYNSDLKDLSKIDTVKIIGISTAVVFVVVIACVLAKIAVSYKLEH